MLGASVFASLSPSLQATIHAPAMASESRTPAHYPRNVAVHRYDPDVGPVVGRVQAARVYEGDTLVDIARRYDVGYWDIVLANPGVDVWIPEPGSFVRIPRRFILPNAPYQGIVINLAELRLYYFPEAVGDGPRHVITHPVGIGRLDWSTPLGVAAVVEKIPRPTWYPPASIRAERRASGEPLPAIVPPGPDNPLGAYALILDIPGYLIHGTNRPAGVGMRVSHGCIRLYPEDIAALFQSVPRKTPVRIVNQPFKLAWHEGALFAEVQPMPAEDDYVSMAAEDHLGLFAELFTEVEQQAGRIGRSLPLRAVLDRDRLLTGIPQRLPLS